MIQNVTAGIPDTTQQSAPAAQKTLCHTPFGDVWVDEMATTNLAGLMSQTPGAASPSPSPARVEGPEVAAAADPTPAASTAAHAVSAPAPTATSTTPSTPSAPVTPTDAKSLFGDQPWLQSPTGHGPNGFTWGFNPIYFATRQTAETVAKMVGGTVVEKSAILSAPGSPFIQDQPNEMIALPNGREIYAGLVADFYNHGYSQDWINRLLKSETQGTES